MSIDRAEAVLTDPSLAEYVDTIVRRTDQGYRAASSRGRVDFCRGASTDAPMVELGTSGAKPIGR